ncbi:MAG: transcriptional regulator [Flavobacteriales bacterium]|nr:transcriptional regulator [Flavobacteriales bacterium]MCB9196327.1 transcriptional regulator [Flavobacteriales bacterium]
MQGFNQLNKAFESRVRLGIMSILLVNDWVNYTDMKDTLGLTDGNLASHVSSLEKLEYIQVRKEFVGKKPQTSYAATQLGKLEFQKHIDGLERLLKGS